MHKLGYWINWAVEDVCLFTCVVWFSGGVGPPEDGTEGKPKDGPKKEANDAEPPADRDSKIQAARERFLARKGKK